MWNSRRGKFLTLVIGSLLLTSCWQAKPHDQSKIKAMSEDPSEQNTNYLVVNVGGSALPTREVSKDWKLPLARHYDFYACLIDRATRNKILGIQFKIKVEDTTVEPWTDENGCLHWQERVPVPNYYADEAYLEMERTIEGLGVYKGPRKLKIAVNPWAGLRRTGNPEIVWVKTGGEIPKDIKVVGREKVKERLAGRSGGNPAAHKDDSVTKQLYMSNVASYIKQIKELDKGVALEIQLSMRPVVKLHSLQGDPSPFPLTAGRFRIYANIVATNLGGSRDESLILTPEIPPSVGTIEEGDGTLRVSLNAHITRRVARGNLQLALRVVPLNAPEELEPFEGLFEIGDFTQLQGKQMLWFNPRASAEGASFKYDDFLKATSNYQKMLDAHQAFKLEPFEFGTMQIKFETIKPGETATTRTVEYSVEACVRNIVSGNRVRDEFFYIDMIPDSRYADLEKAFYPDADQKSKPWCPLGQKPDAAKSCREVAKANHEGCLTWIGHVTHKYYKPEELLFPSVKITHVASGFTKELTLAINPWDLFATFGRDRRVLTDEYVESLRSVGTVGGQTATNGRQKIPSLFFLDYFSYDTLRFRYEIDEFMNLNVKKMLLFRVDPRVVRYSSIVNGRRATESLRDGIYLLKVAVQKDYFDAAAEGVSIGRDMNSGATRLQFEEEAKRKQYITAIKRLVRVQDGTIITPIEISMRDLRLMRIRANLMVQLETIDEKELTKISIMHDELRKLEEQRRLKPDRGGSEAELKAFVAAKMRPIHNYVAKLSEMELNRPGRTSNPGDLEIFYKEMDEVKDLPPEFFARVKDRTMQAYKKNDLTYMPLAPVVDLDSLRDRDSGLEPRVFSGPVTLLLNSNRSYMRPTDNLDEIYCPASDDCDQIKKEFADLRGGRKEDVEYRDSRLFGSVKHLYKKSVDSLIGEMVRLEEQYRSRNSVASLLYTFVRDFNLTYVSLVEAPLVKYDSAKCQSVDENIPEKGNCLSETREGTLSTDSFLQSLNNSRFGTKPVSKEDLVVVIDGAPMEIPFFTRYCDMIGRQAEQAWKRYNQDKKLSIAFGGMRDIRMELSNLCMTTQFDFFKNPRANVPAVFMERKYKVLQTGKYRYKGGKSLNLNVGANFTVNYNQALAWSQSFNPLGPLNGIPVVGSVLSPFALRIGHEETRSRGNGTSVSEQAFLVMQQATMDLELVNYERCLLLRPNPSLGEQLVMFLPINRRNMSDEEKRFVLEATRGTMICKGAAEDKITPIRERYYYFTQHFTEGDQLDSSDIYNHPWLLALRGVRDFRAFAVLLKAVPANNKFEPVVKEEAWSLQHMMNTYRGVHPTFPGLYTILEEAEEKPEYPFEDRPQDSFRNGTRPTPGSGAPPAGK